MVDATSRLFGWSSLKVKSGADIVGNAAVGDRWMARAIEGKLSGEGFRFGIVVSRFNGFITERLLEGAIDGLVRHGVRDADIDVLRVPGAFEIPVATKRLATLNRYHAIICLGAVIRGATPHFEYVAGQVSSGVAAIALETGVPCLFGILTTETIEQAVERAGTKMGNKGWEAALSAVEMANVLAQLQGNW